MNTNINENEQTYASQNKKIADWLSAGNSITALEALDMFGCFRLASRINDLRKTGMEIITEKILTPSGKRVANYKMAIQ